MIKSGIILILLFACAACINTPKKDYFVKVHGYRIYVEESGKGDPVILLHAGFLDHRMWEKQVHDMSSSFRVITVDMPGHGFTVNGDSTVMNNEVLSKVLDSLGIQKAHFVGLSLGGVAVTDFAITHPERCNKIVLAAPGLTGWPFDQDSILKKQSEERSKAFVAGDTVGFVESFVQSWTDGPNRSPDQVNQEVRGAVKTWVLENIKRHQFQHWPGFTENPPAAQVLDSIKSPVLIIVGTIDMKDIIMITNLMESKIPDVRKISMEGVAHMVNLENPVQFNEEVKNFLSAK